MIINSLSRSERTERLHPLFKKLFDYIRTHDLSQQPPGRIVLQGDDLFINLDQPQLRSRETQKLEVHRRYVDVHFPLSGAEEVGWRSLDTLPCESEAPFDEKNDFALYAVPATVYFTVHPGEFYVMFPEDAHAPIIGEGTLHKAIAKVRLAEDE